MTSRREDGRCRPRWHLHLLNHTYWWSRSKMLSTVFVISWPASVGDVASLSQHSPRGIKDTPQIDRAAHAASKMLKYREVERASQFHTKTKPPTEEERTKDSMGPWQNRTSRLSDHLHGPSSFPYSGDLCLELALISVSFLTSKDEEFKPPVPT